MMDLSAFATILALSCGAGGSSVGMLSEQEMTEFSQTNCGQMEQLARIRCYNAIFDQKEGKANIPIPKMIILMEDDDSEPKKYLLVEIY